MGHVIYNGRTFYRRKRGQRWDPHIHGGWIEREFRACQATSGVYGIQDNTLRGRGNGPGCEIVQQHASGYQYGWHSGSVQSWAEVMR